jgi:hypothetical protein
VIGWNPILKAKLVEQLHFTWPSPCRPIITAGPPIPSPLAGIFTKLEWGERDPEVTEAVIADLQRWLRARS